MRPIYLLDCFTGSIFHDAVVYAYIKNKPTNQNAETLKAQRENTKQGVHSFIEIAVATVFPAGFVI